jgi:hypothetical protein
MARTTTTTGKLLAKAPSAKQSKMAKAPVVDADFAAEWNSLEKAERRQIRRLVRIGRPQESADHARLAMAFAAYQRSRAWYRFFYLWIAPILVAGLVAGVNLHPIFIGMVLGGAAVAYMSRRNYKRADKINAPVLAGGTTAASVTPAAA